MVLFSTSSSINSISKNIFSIFIIIKFVLFPGTIALQFPLNIPAMQVYGVSR